jgi:hypothetical protein
LGEDLSVQSSEEVFPLKTTQSNFSDYDALKVAEKEF